MVKNYRLSKKSEACSCNEQSTKLLQPTATNSSYTFWILISYLGIILSFFSFCLIFFNILFETHIKKWVLQFEIRVLLPTAASAISGSGVLGKRVILPLFPVSVRFYSIININRIAGLAVSCLPISYDIFENTKNEAMYNKSMIFFARFSLHLLEDVILDSIFR